MKRTLIITLALMLCSTLVLAGGSKEKYSVATAKEFVDVDAGVFTIGCEDEFENEHEVVVSEFFICTHEVTQEEFQSLMGYNPSKNKGKNKPVNNVTWYEAVDYCNKRSIAEGYTPCYNADYEYDFCADGYRLPTESEWEIAAKGGQKSQGFIYSGDDSIDDVAWHGQNSGHKTHDVRTKAPNELGIYDMTGNVAEWCFDWYGVYPTEREGIDPSGPAFGTERIVRGGSCYFIDENCSVTARNSRTPETKESYIGFRIVRSGPRG
ncbi:MAG: SUMF1/EgtB/PvdO family nonheme iron enzyme [Treponema sp.]|nr:SUMF1/EgtB/PvdO family nonheme iron enzyme [Treponema sp.]